MSVAGALVAFAWFRREVRFALVLAVVAGAQPADAVAQASSAEREADVATPVLLSIAGGLSRGAYQAGLNWALVELFKRSAGEATRARFDLPRYELSGMAGASAGGINGFLTAIEWCDDRGAVPADESLFWRMWMPVGIDQLSPYQDRHSGEGGMFSRVFLDEELLPELTQRRRTASAVRGCRLPVGVTMSRLDPGSVNVSPEVEALTQRVASVVEIVTRDEELVFAPFSPTLSDPTLGGRLGWLVRPLASAGQISDGDIFDLIRASSAFPGAFAQVSVRHQGICSDQETCQRGDWFADGGLFDNSPVSLTAGIYAIDREAQGARVQDETLLVFIDSDGLRGRYREVVEGRPSDPPEVRGGISGLLQLFLGAIPSARQYEMATFARLLAWEPDLFPRENIRATSRGFPIVGDQLAGFGAFFGRPFREADFYVGAYDALHFIARESCRGSDATCVQPRLGELVAAGVLRFSDDPDRASLGNRVLDALLEWESDESLAGFERVSNGTANQTILAEILLATATHAHDVEGPTCEGDAIALALCGPGLARLLNQLRERGVLESIDRSLEAHPAGACNVESWRSSARMCYAGESFRDFVRRPDVELAGLAATMLHRLWHVEDVAAESATEYTDLATLGELTFHSTLGTRYRRGLELNTSSIPLGSPARVVTALIPNYASINLGSVGAEIGYRPMFHFSSQGAIGATVVPLHFIVDRVADRTTFWGGIGPNLHIKWRSPFISGGSVGVEWLWRWGGGDEEFRREVAFPFALYLLGDKLRLGVRVIPANETPLYSRSNFGFSLGLSDVNGLIAWSLRALGADVP